MEGHRKRLRAMGAALVLFVGSGSGCEKAGRGLQRPSGATMFGQQTVSVGDTFEGEFIAKIDVGHPSYDGPPHRTVNENLLFHSAYVMQVLEVERGLPEAVSIQYTGGREYTLADGDLTDDDHALLGRTVEASEGSFRRPGGGRLGSSWEDLVASRDAGRIGTPGTIQAQLRGKSFTVGQSVRLTPGEIMDRLDGETASMLELRFVGLRERCGQTVGSFEASLEVAADIEDGVMLSHLTGSIEVDVATAMLVHVALEGASETAEDFDEPPNGGKGTASVRGTLKPSGRRCG